MQVIIHKQLKILDEIFPKWAQLKVAFYETTFFQELSWIKSWWESQSQNKDITPYIIEIKVENKTIGILPLYMSHKEFAGYRFRIIRPMGAYLSDYLLPICSKEYPLEAQLEKAFEKIYEDKSGWDCIDWSDIPEGSKLDVFLEKQYKTSEKFIKRERGEVCPYLILDKDVEKVKEKFSKKFLKGILYYERKLKREGKLNYYRVERENEIEPIMNKLFELHCERWGNTDTPSQFRVLEERQRVMRVAKDLFEIDLLHLSYLSHNDEIAAVEFGMADDTKRYLYIGAININFGKYPIGHILLYNLILEACEHGYEIMDFLRGEEGYKQRVGTINRYNVQYKIFNKTMKSLLLRKIKGTYYSEQFYEKAKLKQIISKSITRGMIFFLNLPIIRS